MWNRFSEAINPKDNYCVYRLYFKELFVLVDKDFQKKPSFRRELSLPEIS